MKTDDNWKCFVRGQIAVLKNDTDTAAKEFAKVHPGFMNIDDYFYLMSFYRENNMTEDMNILRNDYLARIGSMYMADYDYIPDWSNYAGYKNNLVFSLIQAVSHTQIMLYTDISLAFLRFAQVISDGTNVDAIQDGVNIGVFNLEGLQSLRQYEDKYIVIPIYLIADWKLRFRRMIKREHKIRLEFFRRLFVDNRDFKKSGAVLSGHNGGLLPYVAPYDYDIVLEDVRNTIQKAQSL
jgi:hypothetical protein